MGREVAVMEDEIELSLELTIGGSYATSGTQRTTEGKTGDFPTFNEKHDSIDNDGIVSRSDFVGDVEAENGFGPSDLKERREIRVLRIKTEEKLNKSTGVNNGWVFMEDKLVLEAQQFRARVQEREIRGREWVSEVSGWKRGKNNGRNEEVQDLNISLFTENDGNSGNHYTGRVEVLPLGMNVVRALPDNGGRNSPVDCGTAKWTAAAADVSLEPSSPSVSDYRGMSNKGGNDSNMGSSLNPCASSSDRVDLKEDDHPCSSKTIKKSKLETHSSNETNHTNSTVEDPTTPVSKDTNMSESIMKPPKTSSNHCGGASIQRMPCVSTTGNGPNGKTITGFLYKYSATEVSIMCVCHGSSFSPAGFVEHAGGVDVTNPLRHITVVAARSAS